MHAQRQADCWRQATVHAHQLTSACFRECSCECHPRRPCWMKASVSKAVPALLQMCRACGAHRLTYRLPACQPLSSCMLQRTACKFISYGETIPHSIEDVCVRRGEDVELDLQLVTNRFKCSAGRSACWCPVSHLVGCFYR